MDTSGIVDVLTTLGCTRIRVRDGYVGACCPFAPYKHQDKTDNHPSFSVKVEESRASCYHCFACGSKGLLSFMFKDLSDLGMIVPEGLVDRVRLAEKAFVGLSGITTANMFGVDLERKLVNAENTLWDESEIEPYRGKIHKYVISRGVSILTAKAFEIGHDSENSRVVLPVRNKDKKLVGAMTRTIGGYGSKYLPLKPFKKSLYLYGEDKLVNSKTPTFMETMGSESPASGGVIVVEGNFDVMHLFGFGYENNVVGLMTANMSKAQASTLRGIGRPVYLMTDWDIAGVRGRRGCIELLHGEFPLFDVPGVICCSNDKCQKRFSRVIKDGNNEKLVCRACGADWPDVSAKKDPGMLSKEEITDCLKNAEFVMSKD